MSGKPTREELAAQAELAQLQAELALARAEAARLRLQMAERDEATPPPLPPPATPSPDAALPSETPCLAIESALPTANVGVDTSTPAASLPAATNSPRAAMREPSRPPIAATQAQGQQSAGPGDTTVDRPPAVKSTESAPPHRSGKSEPSSPKNGHRVGQPSRSSSEKTERRVPATPAYPTAKLAAPPKLDKVAPEQRGIAQNAIDDRLPLPLPPPPHVATPPQTQPRIRREVVSEPSFAPVAIEPLPNLPPVIEAAAAKPQSTELSANGEPTDEETVPTKRPRPRFLSGQWFRTAGAWSTSMVVHMALLIILALWMIPGMLTPDPPQLEALQIRPEEELTRELEENLVPATEVTVNTSSSVMQVGQQLTIASATGGTPTFETAVSESINAPTVHVGDVAVWSIKSKDLGTDVPLGAPGNPQAVVDNYDQAFDRITQEILMMLVKSKVLVVWLFDESESMKDDQKEIRDRIEKVYKELGLTDAAKGDALLTAVASYGEKWTMQTRKPTYDLEMIRAAIDNVQVDPSGKEMMCDAVGMTVTALQSVATSGRRQMALIVVTDESGERESNEARLEEAIFAAKAARCRIYVLGREAVFGYPFAHMQRHVPGRGVLWLPIDRGPEAPDPEQLQTEGFQKRYDAHCSGFGPYEQARMARETNGIFFMLPSLETNLVRGEKRRYELEAIRPYMPDLGPRLDYRALRDSQPLRATIWKVIETLNPHKPEIAKHIDLRQRFSANPAAFVQQVNAELVKAEMYVRFLDAAEKELEKLAKERNRESYPRWRANYDLIFAQVLAYKVHVFEYGAYLTHFKEQPKQVPLNKPPNLRLAEWDLRHRQETVAGDKTASYVARAKQLFNDIITNHPGTPWAARAEWELKRGFGVELVEIYHGPPGPPGPPRPPLPPIPKL